MSDDKGWIRDLWANSPGLRNTVNQQNAAAEWARKQERHDRELTRQLEEANEARWAREEEDRARDAAKLRAAEEAATRLTALVEQAEIDASSADRRASAAEDAAKRSRRLAGWSLAVAVLSLIAAATAVVAPFIQSGG